jgi:hypothetical protein
VVETFHTELQSVRKIIQENPVYEDENILSYYQIEKNSNFSIIKCSGCNNISMMIANSEVIDHKYYPSSDPLDDEYYPKTIWSPIEYKYFPEHVKINKSIVDSPHIPEIIKNIYYEALSMVSRKMDQFAALGLRLIIEEIAKNKGATKYHLERF